MSRLLRFAVILLLLLLQLDVCLAQKSRRTPRFKEGDDIQYHWVSKWLPGRVLQVDGKRVAIEYEWGGQIKQEIVGADTLRFAWEERAFTPMRFWSDQAKKFKVRAAAVGLKDGVVVLYKDDGVEVDVPIDKLSDTDQTFLKRYLDKMGPPVAQVPELSTFARSTHRLSIGWSKDQDLAGIQPDGAPSHADLPMKGVAFPKAHFFENLIRVHPIGGADGWLAAGTVDRMEKQPGRILWIALASETVKRTHLVPPGERLTAIDAPSRQFLTVNNEGPRLTLWEADPSKEVPTAKKSWLSLADDNWGSWDNWAEIVAPNRVLHEWGRSQFVVWDVEQEREVYRIDQESFFKSRPALSPGKKLIALPEDKGVRILEASSGNTLANLPIEGGSAAGVGFSQDGTQLAILTRSQLAVWKLGSGEPPRRYRADSIGTPFNAQIEWVGDHSLLVDRTTLYDTRYELPVWSYAAKTFEVKKDSYGERTQTIIADKLCYAVEIQRPQEAFIVGAVELPGPGVSEALENFDRESLYIVRPGDPVNLQLDCGQYDTEVRRALLKQIEDNGWVYDSNATTVLSAKMGRGETQSVTYRSSGTSSRGDQTVTATPYFSRLELLYNGAVAWSSSGGSGIPPMMFLREGETAQAKVAEMQKPDPGLFSRVDVPEKIFDPAKKKGLGSSVISARGLTPQ